MATVTKRNNTTETYSATKVEIFVKTLIDIEPKLNLVDPSVFLPLRGLAKRPTSADVATLVAESAAAHTITHVQYGRLAGRAVVSNLLKTCAPSYSAATAELTHILDPAYVSFVEDNAQKLDAMIVKDNNFLFDIFGIETLKRSYLLRDDDRRHVESPQHLFMRVAVALHRPDMERIKETYTLMSTHNFTHATPTLFNSGCRNGQLASCYLVDMNDSIEGIYGTLKKCAQISKMAGGIGLNIGRIRGSGAPIRGTNGTSNGVVPMLKVFEATADYVDQGGGRRKGSCATFLTPSHPDIIDWLHLRRPDGVESRRARGLFYGLMVPDLFMKRVEQDGQWSLFQPNVCPELEDTFGERYEMLYERFEKEGKACATMPARKIWNTILDSQIESGTPYILFRDTINRHNNQTSLIRQSNLCCEILEVTNQGETAVCTLASVCLPKCVQGGEFSFDHLRKLVDVIIRNLNKTIDRSSYPVHSAKYSHKKRRPVGLGVQGLSDTFQMLSLVVGSEEALEFDAKVFETIYLQACTTSMKLAQKFGYYDTYPFSPMAAGQFQFDLYGEDKVKLNYPEEWKSLRSEILKHGMRNSLLVANMPTASSAQIFGNSESFETRTSNAYVRRTLSGEYIVVNHVLQESRQWTHDMAQNLLANRGSVQNMAELSDHDKKVFRTVFEIKMKDHINHAAVRQPFVDQSQSLNLHFKAPTRKLLTNALFYGWRKQLKTGMYYLRRETKGAMMGTLAAEASKTSQEQKKEMVCTDDVCVMCSS